jgi:hypothetical protein
MAFISLIDRVFTHSFWRRPIKDLRISIVIFNAAYKTALSTEAVMNACPTDPIVSNRMAFSAHADYPLIRSRYMKVFINMMILILAFGIGYVDHIQAQTKLPDMSCFINDRMDEKSSHCKFIPLKTHDLEIHNSSKGSEKSTDDIEKIAETDFIIRCGGHSMSSSTTYDTNKSGIIVILIVYTKPEMLSKELSDTKWPDPGSDGYQKRALFREMRNNLRSYWLSLPIEAQKQVTRAYAVATSPSIGVVYGLSMRFE